MYNFLPKSNKMVYSSSFLHTITSIPTNTKHTHFTRILTKVLNALYVENALSNYSCIFHALTQYFI